MAQTTLFIKLNDRKVPPVQSVQCRHRINIPTLPLAYDSHFHTKIYWSINRADVPSKFVSPATCGTQANSSSTLPWHTLSLKSKYYIHHRVPWRGPRKVRPVQRLATGWTVRGSNPGGGQIFRTRPGRPWGPPSLLYSGYRVFPGGKAAGAWRWTPTVI